MSTSLRPKSPARSPKPFRIVVLQHSPGTPPGAVAVWAEARGHSLDLRKLFAGDPLPDRAQFDWLVSLGGPMNCDQDEKYPFLRLERDLIRASIDEGKAVLGLCLGGQLIARALGARVVKHVHWECGWHKVKLSDPLMPHWQELTAIQWHQDTFEIPPGSQRIATNSITPNQAYRVSEKVVGIQFHPEATPEWVLECSNEKPYPNGLFVQSPEQLKEGLVHTQELRQWFYELLHQMEGAL